MILLDEDKRLVVTGAGRGAASTASRAKRKWLAIVPLALLASPLAYAAYEPTTTHEPSVRITTVEDLRRVARRYTSLTDHEIDQAIREAQDDYEYWVWQNRDPDAVEWLRSRSNRLDALENGPSPGNAELCRLRLSACRVEALGEHNSRLATCGREHDNCMDKHGTCLEDHNACMAEAIKDRLRCINHSADEEEFKRCIAPVVEKELVCDAMKNTCDGLEKECDVHKANCELASQETLARDHALCAVVHNCYPPLPGC